MIIDLVLFREIKGGSKTLNDYMVYELPSGLKICIFIVESTSRDMPYYNTYYITRTDRGAIECEDIYETNAADYHSAHTINTTIHTISHIYCKKRKVFIYDAD